MKLFRLRPSAPARLPAPLLGDTWRVPRAVPPPPGVPVPAERWTVHRDPPLPAERRLRFCAAGHERVEWTGLPGCWFCGAAGGAA